MIAKSTATDADSDTGLDVIPRRCANLASSRGELIIAFYLDLPTARLGRGARRRAIRNPVPKRTAGYIGVQRTNCHLVPPLKHNK